MGVQIEVWGDYACFSRPEMKVERVSYDIITPSAARGLIEAIFWHPGMRWQIDRIHVRSPIVFTNIRRNEVKSKVNASNVRAVMGGAKKPLYLSAKEDIQQRAAMVLRDVRYVIEAHFEMTEQAYEGDSPAKFQTIVQRRLARGQCYMQPYLGCREFAAHFAPFEGELDDPMVKRETRDLGWMLYDIDYSDPENLRPMFFRARLDNGTVEVPPPDSEEVVR